MNIKIPSKICIKNNNYTEACPRGTIETRVDTLNLLLATIVVGCGLLSLIVGRWKMKYPELKISKILNETPSIVQSRVGH